MRWSVFLGVLASTLAATVGAQVTGTVVDDVSGEPISNAIVRIQATGSETFTDESGAFALTDATGATLTVVAGAKGYFYDWSTVSAPEADLELRLEAVPEEEYDFYTFTSPKRCATCHEEQYEQWLDSPMQKAGMNTWVYDIYDGTGTGTEDLPGFVYVRDSVFAESNPASECASCHQPEPWAREPFEPLGDRSEPTAGMLHGVACDMCHRISDIDITKPNFPGIFPGVVTLTRPKIQNWVVMYGVLGDVTYESTGWMRASYQPQLKSEVCAACHQDANDPHETHDFESKDSIISEPTYLEWLDSPYADESSEHYAECVDCHMPATNAAAACDRVFLGRPAGDVRSHRILGTTAEFLENALSLTMEAEVVDETLHVEVAITNDQTGHHVPTGVTIRNMILLVEAWRVSDGEPLEYLGDTVVHDLGGVGDPADGYFAGLPGRLYGKINIAENGTSPTFFTDAVAIVTDNRIPALETDTTKYSFVAPDQSGDITVRARVIYRRSWRALVDGKSWMYDGHGNPLEDIAPPHFGHLMASSEKTLSTGEYPSPDGGVPDGGVPDGGTNPNGGAGGGCAVSDAASTAPTFLLLALALLALRVWRHESTGL